eukprot:96332_1
MGWIDLQDLEMFKGDKEYLVFGYCRRNFQSMPNDIIKECLNYYLDTIYMIFEKESLKELHKSRIERHVIMHGISFTVVLCPNGSNQEDNGYCQFFVELDREQSNISHVVISLLMFSNIARMHIDTGFLSVADDEKGILGWPTNWRESDLPRWTAKDAYLEFCCDLKVLEIKYTNQPIPRRIMNKDHKSVLPLTINQHCLFNGKDMSEKASNQPDGAAVTYDCLDETPYFALAIAPTSADKKCQSVYLGIRIFNLPQNVSKINVESSITMDRIKIMCDYGSYYDETIRNKKFNLKRFKFTYRDYQTTPNPICEFRQEVRKIEEIRMRVNIKLITCWNMNNQIIKKSEWSKWGIGEPNHEEHGSNSNNKKRTKVQEDANEGNPSKKRKLMNE